MSAYNFVVYFDKPTRVWWAYATDSIGQIGDAVHAATKEEAIYALGYAKGATPEKFTRDIGEYMPAYEAELTSAAAIDKRTEELYREARAQAEQEAKHGRA
jgi:hypothetical protein